MTQVKDITDEMVYEAIRTCKKAHVDYMRKCIIDYDQLDSWQQAKAAVNLSILRGKGVKGIPPYPKTSPWEYIDAPEKVVYRKMERMVDQGKLDYGTSLRSAWIVSEEPKS